MTLLVIKYGYMFPLFLSHPQANVVTEFRYIKCSRNGIPILLCSKCVCRIKWSRGLRRGSAAARLLGLRVQISPGAWKSVVRVVCCQVEVSAKSWSLVLRSPTVCVCVCVCVYVWSWSLDYEESLIHWGVSRHENISVYVSATTRIAQGQS